MKKTVWLTLILMLLCVFALSACDTADTPPNNGQQTTDGKDDNHSSDTPTVCQHTFGDWTTVKQATCKEEGTLARTCSKCSETEEESIQKSETHTPVTDAAIPATCKDTGLTEGSHCSVCNKVFVEQTTVPKTEDHTPVADAAVPATCKDTGLTEGSHCFVCNKVFVAQTVVPKTEDHTPITDAAVPATCKDTGLTEGSHCSTCSKVFEEQNEIPQKEHNYVDGYCKSCGEKKTSRGLKIEDYDNYAAVVGIGSCTDTVIIIPDTSPSGKPIEEIGMYAFQNCTNIVEVIIPNDVSCIGLEAFMNCTSLEKITLPTAYEDMQLKTFENCSSLKEITIPNNVFRIGPSCFANCTSLKSVTIPTSVTNYSKDAFKGCTITNLYISSLDAWCDSKFNNPNANPLYCAENLYLNQTLVTTIEINKNIPSRAFMGYDKLTKIVLGNAVKSIGNSAFYKCSELVEVVFGNKLETIDTFAFYNCKKLNEIHLPSSLKTISNKAFYGCSSLQTITVANGLQSLGDYAFGGCSSLRAIDLPSTITYMGISSFEKCASLESITIPFVGVSTRGGQYEAFGSLFGSAQYEGGEMITQIKGSIGTQSYEYSYCIPKGLKHVKILRANASSSSQAFVNCKYIESITFGKNVTFVSIGDFVGCTALTNIYYEGTKEEWKNMFYSESFNSIEGITITCSDGVIEKN